ncbi:MAG: hypothetical protein WEA24_11735 [Gemmatimonadota bacterium]
MKKNRLLMKGAAVVALATVANVTASDHAAAEPEIDTARGCAVCYLEPGICEENAFEDCQELCDSAPSGECQDYEVGGNVSCDTEQTVYEWVDCDGAG